MRRLPDLLFLAGLAIVVLAPLAFGATRIWAYSLLGLLTAFLLAGTALLAFRETAPPVRSVDRWLTAAGLAFGAVLLWAVLQTQSWMPGALHHPSWREAADVLGVPLAGAISVSPVDTWRAIGRYLTYLALFICAYRLCREEERARITLVVLALAVAGYAVYGLVAWFFELRSIFGMPKYKFLGDVTGTFFNRNVFAVFQGLGFVCAGLLLLRGCYRAADGSAGGRDARRALLEYLLSRGAPFLIAALVMAAAMLLSHSRAGLAFSMIGTATAAAAFVIHRDRSVRSALRVLAPLALVGILLWVIGGTTTAQRMADVEISAQLRGSVFTATAQAIGDRPLLGTGLGTFEQAFQAYAPTDGRLHFQQAHNSYLENLMELGIPMGLLLYAALLVPVVICVRGVLRRERGAIYPLAALGATLIVGLHALVDFSLQIPAITAMFAWLLGMGCAQSPRPVGRRSRRAGTVAAVVNTPRMEPADA